MNVREWIDVISRLTLAVVSGALVGLLITELDRKLRELAARKKLQKRVKGTAKKHLHEEKGEIDAKN